MYQLFNKLGDGVSNAPSKSLLMHTELEMSGELVEIVSHLPNNISKYSSKVLNCRNNTIMGLYKGLVIKTCGQL